LARAGKRDGEDGSWVHPGGNSDGLVGHRGTFRGRGNGRSPGGGTVENHSLKLARFA